MILLCAPLPARAARPTLPAPALSSGTFDALFYVTGSTTKLEQVIGDHDWADTTLAVLSQTLRWDVLGNGLGNSFPSGDSLIFLFGDTIGASDQYVPRWAPPPPNAFKWAAGDPIAWSRTKDPEHGLRLRFYTNVAGDSTLKVAPVYPDGSSFDMGGDAIPNSGIDLDGRLYLICSTGTVIVNGTADHTQDSSVVTQFDPVQRTFTAGRTLSRAGDGGHFVFVAPHELPLQFGNTPTDSEVVIFGTGSYRRSDIFLSKIKRSEFASGVRPNGNSSTRFFTGLVDGQPAWSDTESLAVPVVRDDPLSFIGVGETQQPWPNDDPTIGNLSVAWCPAVGLWLLTYDGGRQTGTGSHVKQTDGVYFTYATAPWGPWLVPQQIFNATRDNGFGTFIHHYDHSTGIGSGPAGPTIGSQAINDPDTTTGGNFAPQIIEPYTTVVGDTLKLYYTLSTWNPYTVVKMRSEFLISPGHSLGVGGSVPPSTRPLAVQPNPFRAFTRVLFALPVAGATDVGVYDLAGRRVRTLDHGRLGAGAHAFAWDGTTDGGTIAPAGAYFVQLRAPRVERSVRVVRIE